MLFYHSLWWSAAAAACVRVRVRARAYKQGFQANLAFVWLASSDFALLGLRLQIVSKFSQLRLRFSLPLLYYLECLKYSLKQGQPHLQLVCRARLNGGP